MRAWLQSECSAILDAVAGAIILAGTGRSATGTGGSATSVKAIRTRPPHPELSTLGVKRSASLVSYCRSTPPTAGSGVDECADGEACHTAQTLRWRSRVAIGLDLRLPARDVGVDATTDPRQLHDLTRIRVHRVTRSGRCWEFCAAARREGRYRAAHLRIVRPRGHRSGDPPRERLATGPWGVDAATLHAITEQSDHAINCSPIVAIPAVKSRQPPIDRCNILEYRSTCQIPVAAILSTESTSAKSSRA